ncbi:MAG: DUF2357 domain-containing protein [Firmicutes bacterium]|nr:DUF2357 domain-containing protein [Bacillota bacterium]
MAFTRETYEKYVYEITTLLKSGELYPSYGKNILAGKNDFKLSQVFSQKNYSTDWIDQLEDCVNALDTIVRNPRKFIVIEEDIVDISLARSISVESVKHLAQHTNLISSVTKEGMVLPNKILNTSKEESFEIYENRFVYTLLLKTRDFLNRRFDAIKAALLESGDLGVEINSEFLLDGHKVNFKLESSATFPFEAVSGTKDKGTGPSDVERLSRIQSIFNDFLSSAFCREMRNSAPVRPPIQRTNVILKDPNFKKALVLWQFVESAESMEFKIETAKQTVELPEGHGDKFRTLIFLNTVMLQSIAAAKESFEKREEKKKRIEDIVPDDYPTLKLKLNEVQKIFHKIPQVAISQIATTKINMAIDRVLRQVKINREKEDSLRRQKLIAQQLKEEEEARKLALREAKEEERLKKRAEAEAEAERKRLEQEKAEREKREAEERELLEIRLQEEARLAVEAEKERIQKEHEAQLEALLEEERLRQDEGYQEALRRASEEYVSAREAYWQQQKELQIRLLSEDNPKLLTGMQTDAFLKITSDTQQRINAIEGVMKCLRKAMEAENENEIIRIMDEALSFRDYEDILSIRADIYDHEKPHPKQDYYRVRQKFMKEQLKMRKKSAK